MIPPELMESEQLDDATRAQVQRFVKRALARAEDLLEHGTPENQMNLFKTLMPLLTRQLEAQKENEQLAEMRARLDDYFAELRASMLPSDADLAVAALDAIPEDAPPPDKPPVRSRARKKPAVK